MNIVGELKENLQKFKQNQIVEKIISFLTHPKLKAAARRWIWILVRTMFLIGFTFIILYPYLIIISKAFMLRADLHDPGVVLIPKHFTLANFDIVAGNMYYWRSLKNSATLALGVTALQLVSCVLVGYGFARFKFPLKGLLFTLVIATLIIPPQIMMSAIFINFKWFNPLGLATLFSGGTVRGWNLINGLWPYFLLAGTAMGIKNGLFIYIFRQTFRNMPKETEEAALVDGAGTFKTFYRIMLPDALTAIVTVSLFSFVWQWNDSIYNQLFAPMLLTGPDMKNTLFLLTNSYELIGINWIKDVPYRDDGKYLALMKSTGVFMIMMPPVIFYLMLQRFFIQSIERTGVVG